MRYSTRKPEPGPNIQQPIAATQKRREILGPQRISHTPPNTDPPRHRCIRRPLSKYLTPAQPHQQQKHSTSFVDSLTNPTRESGEATYK